MKLLGDDVYIQRGETWSLDFDVTNKKGDPYMLLKNWRNPYLAITVTAARYEQEGDFRRTYWLDLSKKWQELQDGSMQLVPFKKFISTEALSLPNNSFSILDAIDWYGTANGGKIVLDETSDFDIKNYLFYIDPQHDGNRIYKYVRRYVVDHKRIVDSYEDPFTHETINNIQEWDEVTVEEWETYDFRVIKEFTTKDWMEQTYLFDMKILAGETVQEFVTTVLQMQQLTPITTTWSDTQTREYIEQIEDEETRLYVQEVFESGMPLMPDYDTKSLILQPTKLIVSANIQGGVK